MKTIWAWVQTAFSTAGGWLGWTLGGVDGFLYALIAFVVADYTTGVMRAILDKRLSSVVGVRGILRSSSSSSPMFRRYEVFKHSGK